MFDLTDVSTEDVFAPMADGIYPSYVDKAEFKESKAGNRYLNIQFKIFGERNNNRVFFNMLNLFHDKEQVRTIAMSELKRMLTASGVTEMKFASDEELLDAVLACRMNVKLGNKTDSFGTKNTVKGYSKLEEEQSPFGDTSAESAPF